MKVFLTVIAVFIGSAVYADSAQSQTLVRRTIRCESNNYNPAQCPIDLDPTRRPYVNQISKTACIEGQTFAIYRDWIAVDRGCRADFFFEGWTWNVRPGDTVLSRWREATVRCESFGGSQASCSTPFRYVTDVNIQRQLSKTRCEKNVNFWSSGGYVFVDRGCRAIFRVNGY